MATPKTLVFKKSDGSLYFGGTVVPTNLRTDDYVSVTIPEDEKLDSEYTYTLVDGVVTKGDKTPINDPPS